MKSVSRISISILMLVVFILTACGKGTSTPTAASGSNGVYTRIWQTVAAGQTLTAAAATPTLAPTETPAVSVTPKNTNTPLVSATSEGGATAAPTSGVTNVPTNTRAPQPTSANACDNSQFIADVTLADGTEVLPGQTLVKTWRIKNLGPCVWNQDYTLAFGWGGDGTEWNTADSTHFNKKVAVGDTIDVSIELKMPSKSGTYGATFRTMNDNDFYFGPSLTILIVVK